MYCNVLQCVVGVCMCVYVFWSSATIGTRFCTSDFVRMFACCYFKEWMILGKQLNGCI